MIKKLIILALASTLTLATGCTKEDEAAGLWVDIAKEEIAEDKAVEEEAKELSEKQFEQIDFYPFLDENTGLWGYMNSKGKTVIEPQFIRAEDFNYLNRLAVVLDEQERMNYIDENGKFLFKEFEYKGLEYPILGLVPFADEQDAWGVMDLDGNIILSQQYGRVGINVDGYITFEENGKCGMADDKGKILVEPLYDNVFGGASGIIIRNDDKYGVYDGQGKELLPIVYEDMQFLTKDLIALKDESGKYAMYNYNGEKITDHIYDEMNGYGRTMIQVSQEDKWGYLNNDGEVVVDIQYEQIDISILDPRYAQVKVDGKYGIMDMYGDYLLEPKYDYINLGFNDDGTLNDKCFIVREGEKRSLIDKTGNILREDLYEGLMIYEDFIMGMNNEYQYILLDLQGKDIGKYKYIHGVDGDYILVKDREEDQEGYIVDYYTGEVISEERYENIYTNLQYNMVITTKGENIYIMDENCDIVSELHSGKIGIWPRDIVIYGEDLIKMEDVLGGIHWINSKGERIK